MQGKVKFFNDVKGFGFITKEDNTDIFVHASGLLDRVKQNDVVLFDVEEGKKGPKAVHVKKLQ